MIFDFSSYFFSKINHLFDCFFDCRELVWATLFFYRIFQKSKFISKVLGDVQFICVFFGLN